MFSQKPCFGGGRWDIGWRKDRRDVAIGNKEGSSGHTEGPNIVFRKEEISGKKNKGQEVLGILQVDHRILRWTKTSSLLCITCLWDREMRLVHSHVPGCSLDFKSCFCSWIICLFLLGPILSSQG